jgi:hypothetical protein
VPDGVSADVRLEQVQVQLAADLAGCAVLGFVRRKMIQGDNGVAVQDGVGAADARIEA